MKPGLTFFLLFLIGVSTYGFNISAGLRDGLNYIIETEAEFEREVEEEQEQFIQSVKSFYRRITDSINDAINKEI